MKKEEKTELTKAKIFAAAMQEFGTKGYAAGSLNNICKTGINKGLIYHNFKDKDELYLECVKKSCEDLICYVMEHNAEKGFVEYMGERRNFFEERELEAYVFLEARTNPPQHLVHQIREIYTEIDVMNMKIFENELSQHELREGVSKEEAIHYFMEYLGFTLLPHSGVSLVFTGIVCATLDGGGESELAVIIKGTIAAAAVINEIIAVIMAKKGFERAGEI